MARSTYVPSLSVGSYMARALWSGAISLGLVNIPVKRFPATENRDLSFPTLHAACRTPLKRPYMCPKDSVSVEAKDMAKGYEFAKAQYVLMADEDVLGLRELVPL